VAEPLGVCSNRVDGKLRKIYFSQTNNTKKKAIVEKLRAFLLKTYGREVYSETNEWFSLLFNSRTSTFVVCKGYRRLFSDYFRIPVDILDEFENKKDEETLLPTNLVTAQNPEVKLSPSGDFANTPLTTVGYPNCPDVPKYMRVKYINATSKERQAIGKHLKDFLTKKYHHTYHVYEKAQFLLGKLFDGKFPIEKICVFFEELFKDKWSIPESVIH